jgi:hypothetical protein
MRRQSALSIILITSGLALAGCASAVPGYTPNPKKVPTDTSGTLTQEGYQLSAEELKLDCKRLTGRMQVRILQSRDASTRPEGSDASRAIKSVTTPLLGSTSFGLDPVGQAARDRAVLEAYNRQLAAKNCATFDLEAELKPKPVTETPRPTAKPKS